MEVLAYETREEWLEGRRGRVTGSTAKDIISTGGPTKEMIASVLEAKGVDFKKSDKKEVLEALLDSSDKKALFAHLPKKIGFYRLVAELMGLPPDGEDPMDRGSRMEVEVMERFTKETGKKLDTSLVLWTRSDDSGISVSPDASVIGENEAVEAKCLGSAYHIKAWVEKAIPEEYWFQVLQYFIVNDLLQKLHFCFYDPRIPAKDFFIIEVTREQVQKEVDEYLDYQRAQLAEVREIVNALTF